MGRILVCCVILSASLVGCMSDGALQVDTRVYDVRDVLIDAPAFLPAPEFDLSAAMTCQSSAARPVDDADAMLMRMRNERRDALVNEIENSVGDEAGWARYGGETSSIRELNGNLIIRTTQANHREIERILHARRVQSGNTAPPREGTPIVGDVP